MDLFRKIVLSTSVIFGLMTITCFQAKAQTPSKPMASLAGRVISAETGEPIDFATVSLSPSNHYAVTDKDGRFVIERIPSGRTDVTVQFFGMETIDTTLLLHPNQQHRIEFVMQTTSFRLENVVVVATQNKAGSSTASTISRQAMDHLQTSSLKDIMSLLPGMDISNPTLSSAQTITIRNAGGTSGSEAMNSLGTAIIVDGAPMSNNANLQTLTMVQSGSANMSSGGGSPLSGSDIRSISTDNIESIEVIRGIPSVEYGDMTSGAVLVKSRAGRSPLIVRFKTNPNIYQVSAAKGLKLSDKMGDLNLSGDYAYNRNQLTRSYANYQRATAKALWTVLLTPNTTANTSLSFIYGRDTEKLNPDMESTKTQSHAQDLGVSFNTNGRAAINRGWLKSVNWLLSGSFTNKESHYESTAINAMNLYSTAMIDGLTYTNRPGMDAFDIDGNCLTNTSIDPSIKGKVMPYSYFYSYDIFGKEINTYAKLNADFGKSWQQVTERLLIGADYKSDGNLGQGSVYDDDTPPHRNIGNTESGYRRRPYYDIPFIHQVGAYAENHLNVQFADREANLSAGLRYDWINGMTAWSPRINASLDVMPWMTLRGGWGLTSKAPTAIYLYPNKAYQDVINFNGMSVNTPPEEQLLVATTKVYDCSNPDLEIAQNRKAEIGLDFRLLDRFRLSLTAYDECMKNGYNFGLQPSSFIWYQHVAYKVAQLNPGTIPTLETDAISHRFFQIYQPLNNVVAKNRGLEYEIDLGRFDDIRTSFYINGAWMKSITTNKGYSFGTRNNSWSSEYNVGIYNPEKETYFSERLNTTLRATHNIPQIGFAITLTTQVNWMEKYWTEFKNDDMFIQYISRLDGKIYDFDPSKRNDPEFSYMFPTLNDTRFIAEDYPTYLLFNLNLSKEIGDRMTTSFYVNNVFNYRPLYQSKKSGISSELSIPIFFGFEFKVSI